MAATQPAQAASFTIGEIEAKIGSDVLRAAQTVNRR